MKRKKFPWNIIFLLLGIITLVVGTYVAYNIHKKQLKSTKLTIIQVNRINPLIFVDDSVSKRIAFLVDGKKTESLYIYNFEITNSGDNPILPEDFVEPLQVSVNQPWEILDTKTIRTAPTNLVINWSKKRKNKFEMVPSLLNPADQVVVVMLLNNPKGPATEKSDFFSFYLGEEKNAPRLRWNARIANLKEIDLRSFPHILEEMKPHPFLTSITFKGWDVYWYILAVLIFFLFGYWSAKKGGRLQLLSRYQMLILIFIMLFSLSVAEIVVDLLIHKDIKGQWGGSWAILVLYLIFYFYLVWPIVKTNLMKVK